MIKKHVEMPPEVIDQTVLDIQAIKGNPPFLNDFPIDEQVKIQNLSRKVIDFIEEAQRHAKSHAHYFPLVSPFEKDEKE
ncbi:MAG: hypothetical protein NT166_06365 [Candidatus Aminicenantes bacterium]|nr:hypothetical protein [Candidatus Aminicenantes bacterium]